MKMTKGIWSLCYCGTGQTIVKQTENRAKTSESIVFNMSNKNEKSLIVEQQNSNKVL